MWGRVAANWLIGEIGRTVQPRIEGYQNLVPIADLTFGLIVGAELGAFQVTEVADIVDWAVGANDAQRLLAARGKFHAAREDYVKDYVAAIIGFTPNAKVFCELIAERAIIVATGANG